MKIMIITVWKILKREGISQPGQATMEKFQGTGGKHGISVREPEVSRAKER